MKTLLFCLLFSVTYAQTQVDKALLGKHLDKWDYFNMIDKNPKTPHAFVLENGKTYNQTFLDSLKKVNDYDKYTQEYFLDSITQKITVMLRKRTEDEIKMTNEKFQQYQKDAKNNRRKLLGSKLSDLNFTDIKGRNYSDADFKGSIVLLNFWFTKCAPCIKEMPDLNTLNEKYKDQNVQFYAITHDDSEIVNRFLKKIKLDLTVVTNEKKTENKLGIDFFPTSILMDEEGKVLFVSEIFNPKGDDLKQIEKIIKKKIKNK